MGMLSSIRQWGADLLSIIYPPLCEVCGSRLVHGEKHICLHCNLSMPRCNIESDPFNTIHKRLLRHVPVERAAAYFFYFRGSRFTNLIQSAKYRNRPDIATYLAFNFANEIESSGFFESIDVIVPVPMHKRKQKRRGYNQAEVIAQAISSFTRIPVNNLLTASRPHSTQTRRSAFERWQNSKGIYQINPDTNCSSARHILIVDDVITTGSTISACCEILHDHFPTAKISVLTLAATEME